MTKAMKKGHEILYLECKEPERTGSLKAVARKLARYKLDKQGVQEVRWNNGDMVRAGDYNFFLWKKKQQSSIGKLICCTS
jgi:hypothetical protein